MTRVIHTGDTHIGYKQYHSPERRRDFLAAFERVIDDAIDDDVDAVVHAGDLFHDRRPELRDLLGVLSALRRLDDAGVPFLAIVGNHESARGGQWLDLFERLDLATRLDDEPTVVGDVAFYGLDHVPRSRRDDLDYRFADHDAAHAALVGHGLFTPFAHADWDTEEVLTESNLDFDALLLGDNHAADAVQVEGTWVTYCGSTERASASERDGRGYNLVAFDGEVDIRRRALDTRPFAFVTVELAEDEGAERVRERVREHDLEDAVAVVEITGEGEPVTPAAVEKFAVERGALIARVNDRREFEDEEDIDVNFADPDAAVRERVAEMGLSAAGLDVDEVVRTTDAIADSNVREEVKQGVRDRLDDLDAFEPAAEGTAFDAGEGHDGADEADADGAGEAAADGADEAAADDGDVPAADDADANVCEEAGPDDPIGADASAETDGPPETGGSSGASDSAETEASSEDGQVSMEDYL